MSGTSDTDGNDQLRSSFLPVEAADPSIARPAADFCMKYGVFQHQYFNFIPEGDTTTVNFPLSTGAKRQTPIVLIGLTQQFDKLVFENASQKMLSLRTSAHTGVAIPRLKGTR